MTASPFPEMLMFNRALRHSWITLLLLLPVPSAIAGTAPDVSAKAAVEKLIEQDERPDPATAIQLAKSGAVLLDVRSEEEWAAGHAKGAAFMPWRTVSDQALQRFPDKDAPIITYCAVGGRAKIAARSLRILGYTHVLAMSDGFDELKAAGYPVEVSPALAKQ